MLMLNEKHASRFGLKESIILHKVIFYVLLNKKDGRNFHKGRNWTFNGRRGWAEVFPCFSHMQIWRSFKNLEKSGALISDSFNKKGYDKTRWYSLSDSMMQEVSRSKYWKKAICSTEISRNKSATSYNKIETPIPLNNIIDNNIILDEVKPY